jgi:exonuclease VII small subunit
VASDVTRKLLKVFGIAVTDFEDQAAALIERAETLKAQGAPPEEAVALLEEAVRSVTMVTERWGEVQSYLQDVQQKLLGAARGVLEMARRKP